MSATPRTVRIAWILGVVLLVGCVAGAGYVMNSPAAETSGKLASSSASTQAAVVCNGRMDIDGIVDMVTTMSGPVVEVLVHENEQVKAGQILVRVDDRLAKYKVDQAEAGLKEAHVKLKLAQKLPRDKDYKIAQQKEAIDAERNKLEGAQEESKRAEKLYNSSNLSIEQLNSARKGVKALESSVRAAELKLEALKEIDDPTLLIQQAEAAVAHSESQLREAKYGLEECSLRAPKAGSIVKVYVRQGDFMGPQTRSMMQPGAVQFCPEGPLMVRAEVPQEFAGRIALGQEASVEDHTTVGKGTQWKGKVTFIANTYSPSRKYPDTFGLTDQRTLELHVAVEPNPEAPLRINQQMRVTLGKIAK